MSTRVGEIGAVASSAAGGSPSATRDQRRFRVLVAVLAGLFLAFALATVLPTPSPALSVGRNVFVLPIPLLACWAYVRSPARLRRPLLLFALAAIIWVAGSAVWYGYFFSAGGKVPEPPGPADSFFFLARLLILAGLVAALKSAVSFRIAALDAAVIVSAGLALGAAFVGNSLKEGLSESTLITLNGPILGIVTLMVIVSAAFGSMEGLPRSFALLGAGTAALTTGSLIYSFQAVRHAYGDDRWAGLAWVFGAVLVILAASLIILRLDRPVRISARAAIPNQPPGSDSVLLLSLSALAITLGVAHYGDAADSGPVALVGLLTSAVVGGAMALRARESIRTAEDAYSRLDRALADAEHARDELILANEELRKANVQLQAMQIALRDALNLADERTHGRMRELIEDVGGELADLLEEQLTRRQKL